MDFTEYDTRLAAYAVVVDAGRILLALWNEELPLKWTLPGGGVELDETPEEAAVREAREETGYEVALGRILGLHSNVVPAERRLRPSAKPRRDLRILFEAQVTGGELRHETSGTTDEARWIPLAEVSSVPRVPHVDLALALLAHAASTDDTPFP